MFVWVVVCGGLMVEDIGDSEAVVVVVVDVVVYSGCSILVLVGVLRWWRNEGG